jgi:hypothetical protein
MVLYVEAIFWHPEGTILLLSGVNASGTVYTCGPLDRQVYKASKLYTFGMVYA